MGYSRYRSAGTLKLLVGNFGDGKINAFDPTTGAFVGTIENTLGQSLVNNNLWALRFGTGTNANTLYVTAGLNNQAGGLFASIQPVDSAIQFHVSPTTMVYPTSTTVSVCVTPATSAPATGTVKILEGRRPSWPICLCRAIAAPPGL